MLERGDWVWSSSVSLRLSVSLHAYRQGPPVTRPLRIPGAGGGKPYYCRQAGIPNPNRFRETRGCGGGRGRVWLVGQGGGQMARNTGQLVPSSCIVHGQPCRI